MVLFDYLQDYQPYFYRNSSKYFRTEDIHVGRNLGLITGNIW